MTTVEARLSSRTRLRRGLVLLLVAVTGMAIGALVYYLLRWSGVGVYLLTGAVTAVIGAVAWQWFTNSTAVAEVELTVPQFSRVTFAVTRDHRVLARRILIQLVSRVSIRPLQPGTGRVDEAIKSLHTLFLIVRDLLSEDAESRIPTGLADVDVLAMNLLNCHLAPFLSKWHPEYDNWRRDNEHAPENSWPDDRSFRADLETLQQGLHPVAVSFADLAGYQQHHKLIGLERE